MQFKLYKTSSPYETVINSMSDISSIKILLKERLPEVDGNEYLLQYEEYVEFGDVRVLIPARFYLYILNIKNNVLVLLELMRGIKNEETIKKKLDSYFKLEEVRFTNNFIMEVYREFSRKFLGAYVRTNRGVYLEVETESEFEIILQKRDTEIHSITFIPKIEYEGIPLVSIRREGVIIVDMDHKTAIKFIGKVLDKISIL